MMEHFNLNAFETSICILNEDSHRLTLTYKLTCIFILNYFLFFITFNVSIINIINLPTN